MLESLVPEEELRDICAAEFIPWEKLRGATLLVSGATGLIGNVLVRALLCANRERKLGLSLLALVRDEARARERFADLLTADCPLRLVLGCVEELPEIEGPVDYILHGASQTASRAFVERPVETIRTSVLGTMNLLELARRKRSSGMAYLSSMEVYGHPERGHKVKEGDACALSPLELRDSYPIAKLQSESLCRAYAAEYGVPAAIVRLAQTFGPGARADDGRIFAELGRCIREGRDIVLRTRGETERSYLYVTDAVTALLTALLRGEPGCAYNAADEDSYRSIADMARELAEANGIRLRFDLADESRTGYPKPVYMDLDTTLLKGLGWHVGARGLAGAESMPKG